MGKEEVIGSSGSVGGNSGQALKSFIERIERLEEEKAGIASDIREIFSEAKGNGFDTKVMRALIRRRKMDRAELQEFDSILELYEGIFG